MNDYYQFAILSAVVVAVYAFLYFVVHPLAKWIAIKTPNKFDDLLVKKKVTCALFCAGDNSGAVVPVCAREGPLAL